MKFVKILSYAVLAQAVYAPPASNNLHAPFNAGVFTSPIARRQTICGSIGNRDVQTGPLQINKNTRRKTITNDPGATLEPSVGQSSATTSRAVKRNNGPHRPIQRTQSIYAGLTPIPESPTLTRQATDKDQSPPINTGIADNTQDIAPVHYYIGDPNSDPDSQATYKTATSLGTALKEEGLFKANYSSPQSLKPAHRFYSLPEQNSYETLANFLSGPPRSSQIIYDTLAHFLGCSEEDLPLPPCSTPCDQLSFFLGLTEAELSFVASRISRNTLAHFLECLETELPSVPHTKQKVPAYKR